MAVPLLRGFCGFLVEHGQHPCSITANGLDPGGVGQLIGSRLKSKTPDQLRDSLVALKKEAFNLRFQAATNQLTNTARIKAVRRDAARVKTVLAQKAIEAAK